MKLAIIMSIMNTAKNSALKYKQLISCDSL